MSELKAFDVGLGQYSEDGSPCVVAFDADRNPRLLNEKVYLKSEADAVITELNVQVNGLRNRANLWLYNAQNEHNAAVAVHMENAKLKAKLAEKDKKIAELKEQYKDMDVTHTVHIAKMNAKIEELEQKLQDQCMSCPVKMQEDDVVAEKDNEIRRQKRALWLDRAECAHVTTLLWNVYCYQNNCLYFRDFMNEKCNPFRNLPKKTAMEWSDLWETIEIKCRAKAEEYK